MYYGYPPQYPISQQVSLSLNLTSLSPVLHVGREGHSLGLQSTTLALVQVHVWQLAVHMSPAYRNKPSLNFYSHMEGQQICIKVEKSYVLTDFSSPSGPWQTVNMK